MVRKTQCHLTCVHLQVIMQSLVHRWVWDSGKLSKRVETVVRSVCLRFRSSHKGKRFQITDAERFTWIEPKIWSRQRQKRSFLFFLQIFMLALAWKRQKHLSISSKGKSSYFFLLLSKRIENLILYLYTYLQDTFLTDREHEREARRKISPPTANHLRCNLIWRTEELRSKFQTEHRLSRVWYCRIPRHLQHSKNRGRQFFNCSTKPFQKFNQESKE